MKYDIAFLRRGDGTAAFTGINTTRKRYNLVKACQRWARRNHPSWRLAFSLTGDGIIIVSRTR